jgi:hypothetical protein
MTRETTAINLGDFTEDKKEIRIERGYHGIMLGFNIFPSHP